MFNNKFSKNILAGLLVSGLLICLQIEIFGQCGTYFKRLSTDLVPVNGILHETHDMTGDGVSDLVGWGIGTPQNLPTRMIILPATGNGSFGSPIFIDAPSPFTIYNHAVGDFDTDNFKDVIISFFTTPISYQVYKNNGNGTFTAQTLTSTNHGNPVYLIDINNDGKGDLISEFSSTDIRYSLGNGDGTFAAPVQFSNSNNILPGDFNNDGKVDFITKNSLLINQGGGIFTTVNNPLNLAPNEYNRYVRDFNGDGKLDVLALRVSNEAQIILFTNLGSNSFSRTDFNVAPNHGNLYVGNFSGDGNLDFLFGGEFDFQTIVFTNNGAGGFTRQDFNYYFNGRFTGDFDSDGKTDLLNVSNGFYPTSRPVKFFQEITVTFQKNVCTRPGQPRIVDFNRSGTTDFSYWNPADGRWAIQFYDSVNWGLGSLGDIPAPGDYDGDGVTDFAVYRNSTGVWYIRKSSDQNYFAVQFGVPGDKPVAGDFDGDSVTDIAVWRPSDGNWYIWFIGTQQFSIAHFGAEGDKPVPEDYDGDLKTDLAVFRPSTGVWYYLKSSDGNVAVVQWGLGTDKPVAADYDGDGKADIAVYRESQNLLYILRSYNFSFVAFQFGISGDIPQPGDFNGDFIFDFGIYRPSLSRWYTTNSFEQINFGAGNVIPTSSILRIE